MKKGYFFVLDAMLGLIILVVGVFLISTSYINTPQPTQVGLLSDDIMNFLSNVKIKNLNNPYAGIGGELWKSGEITEQDNSLLQQIGEFYEKYRVSSDNDVRNKYLNLTEKFIVNVSQGSVPSQFRYEIWINSFMLYPKAPSSEHIFSRDTTKLLLTSKKIAFGIISRDTGDIWGPYKAEVFVWEK